jgi:hypothetical protein
MALMAISRGAFCGGEALAKWVAERLGYVSLSRVGLGMPCETVARPAEADEFDATPESRKVMWGAAPIHRPSHCGSRVVSGGR